MVWAALVKESHIKFIKVFCLLVVLHLDGRNLSIFALRADVLLVSILIQEFKGWFSSFAICILIFTVLYYRYYDCYYSMQAAVWFILCKLSLSPMFYYLDYLCYLRMYFFVVFPWSWWLCCANLCHIEFLLFCFCIDNIFWFEAKLYPCIHCAMQQIYDCYYSMQATVWFILCKI